ncbi:hypothetical protein Q7P37_007537 [Cladosporium fusiforme]
MAGRIPRKRPSGFVLVDGNNSGDVGRVAEPAAARGVVGLGVESIIAKNAPTHRTPQPNSNNNINNEEEAADPDPDRRDSHLQPTSLPTKTPTTTPTVPSPHSPPTTCAGHFDRPNVPYTPKPGIRTVVLYYDSDAASSASSIERAEANGEANITLFRPVGVEGGDFMEVESGSLEDAEGESDDWFGGDGDGDADVGLWEGDEGGEEGSGTAGGVRKTVRFEQGFYGDGDDDGSPPPPPPPPPRRDKGKGRAVDSAAFFTSQDNIQRATDHTSNSPPQPASPESLLTSLAVSASAEALEGGEDLYFAGRLASASVIFVRDGHICEAGRLGQWSVDLVGKELWDRMVRRHASVPRDVDDDVRWARYVLGEVVIVLGKLDVARAEELGRIVLAWEEGGILPDA